jgi:hypothetical protein
MTSEMRCPDTEDIAAFLEGKLPADQRRRMLHHLAICHSCYEVFAGAARFLEDECRGTPGNGKEEIGEH